MAKRNKNGDIKVKHSKTKSTVSVNVAGEKVKIDVSAKTRRTIIIIIAVLLISFAILCWVCPDILVSIRKFIYGEDNKSFITQINPDGSVEVSEMKDLKVHFVDVGQGDAIILELPDGKNMIIDSADSSGSKALIDYIDNVLKIKTFDIALITHADADHISGFKKVFENYDVKKVYRPYVLSTNEFSSNFDETYNLGSIKQKSVTYYNVLKAISEETYIENDETKSCEWAFFNRNSDFANKIICNGEDFVYTFDFLTPTSEISDISYKDPNDYSPIMLFEYCGYKIMFTGDAEAENEKEFVKAYAEDGEYLDVDLLKVSHHGSNTSTTVDFLNVIKPEYSVISVGTGNIYHHPTRGCLDRLIDANSIIYRTDTNGNIVLTVDCMGHATIDMDNHDCSLNNILVG